MPEGDAVLRTARRLDRALSGHALTGADLRVPRLATADLTGARVVETRARGKHLLTRLDLDGELLTLHTHLRMDGSWRIIEPGRRWPAPAHQVRAVLKTTDVTAVGVLLGVVELVRTAEEHQIVGHLGPDLLADDWDEDEAVRRLATHPDEAVFDALRDQTLVAGLGTMWAAEVLFSLGVHPFARVAEVADLRRLMRIARLKLQQAMDRRPPLAVYGRSRQPCRRCGTPVRVVQTGPPGEERPAYWCPSCQPERR